MANFKIPCPHCTDGFTSTEDRHARTKQDVCRHCGGDMMADARTGETPETSYSATSWRPGMLARNVKYYAPGFTIFPAHGETAYVQRVTLVNGNLYLGFGSITEHTYLANMYEEVSPVLTVDEDPMFLGAAYLVRVAPTRPQISTGGFYWDRASIQSAFVAGYKSGISQSQLSRPNAFGTALTKLPIQAEATRKHEDPQDRIERLRWQLRQHGNVDAEDLEWLVEEAARRNGAQLGAGDGITAARFMRAAYEVAGPRPRDRFGVEPTWVADLYEVERRASRSIGTGNGEASGS